MSIENKQLFCRDKGAVSDSVRNHLRRLHRFTVDGGARASVIRLFHSSFYWQIMPQDLGQVTWTPLCPTEISSLLHPSSSGLIVFSNVEIQSTFGVSAACPGSYAPLLLRRQDGI